VTGGGGSSGVTVRHGATGVLTGALTLLTALAAATPMATAEGGQSPPEEAVRQDRSLEDAQRLLEEGRLAEAADLARGILPAIEARHGPESIQVARVLDVLVGSVWRRYEAIEPDILGLARRAVAIKEKVLCGRSQSSGPQSCQVSRVVLSVAAVPHPAGPSAQGVEAVTTIQELRGRT